MLSMIDQLYSYIVAQLQTNQFFSGAALATVMASLMYQLKAWPSRALSWVYSRIVFTTSVWGESEFYPLLAEYLTQEHGSLRSASAYDRGFHVVETPRLTNKAEVAKTAAEPLRAIVRPHTDNRKYRYLRLAPDRLVRVVWYSGRPFLVVHDKETLQQGNHGPYSWRLSYTLRSFFGAEHVYAFLNELAIQHVAKLREESTIPVYMNIGAYWRKLKRTHRGLDTLALDRDVRQQVMDQLAHFERAQRRYTDLGVPYKHTLLLSGPPGTGKTSLSAAIATLFQRPLYYLSLTGLRPDEFNQLLYQELDAENTVLVIEDIDAVYNGRDTDGDIPFSMLLNFLDGVTSIPGLLTILTTNHIERLDPALLRKGRVNTCVTVGLPTRETIADYFRVLYGADCPDLKQPKPGVSMADVSAVVLEHESIADAVASYNTTYGE